MKRAVDKMEKKLTVKQNMLWNSIGSFAYLICQWLITIVVVRLSNYENAGILSLAISVNNIFYTISTFGLRHYQVSDINNQYTDKEYIVARMLSCLLGMVCCCVFLGLNSKHYNAMQTTCVLVYFMFKSVEAFIDVFQGIQQKKYRMDYVGRSYVVRGILTLVGFSATLKFTNNVAVGVIVMAVSSLIVAVFYDYKICKSLMPVKDSLRLNKIWDLLKNNVSLMINAVFMTGFVSVSRYFLELYEGEKMLGIYASIATPTVIIQTACGMIYSPLVSEYAKFYVNKDKKKFVGLIKSVSMVFTLIFAVCVVGIFLVGDFFLKLLFGPAILEYSYLLLQTIVVTFLVSIVYWLSAILVVERKQNMVMLVNGLGIIINVIMSMIIIPVYKINGINYALLIALSFDIILLIMIVYATTKKYFEVKKGKIC